MREFDHVVLTRFSAVHVAGQAPMPDDLLRYRLGFFREACVPSVRAQTEPDFRWLVFLDDRCPDDFRAEMEDLATGVFEPVWGHRLFWDGVFRDAVAERTDAAYLLTTRFDSDDALARDFVASVQARFSRQDGLFVNFTRGLQVDRSGRVYRYDHSSNPFLSYVEQRRPHVLPTTVFGPRGHSSVRDHGPVLEVRAAPMWLQVIHGGNLSNDVRGSRVHPRVVRERFEIDLAYDEHPGAVRLAREKVEQQARVWLLRTRRRELAREWLGTRWSRLRGTHLQPARTAGGVGASRGRRQRTQRRRFGTDRPG
jgi:hypothetical protein